MYETLIWEETFPGCSLNEHNWNRRVGNWQLSSDGQPVVPGWGNRERQYYTPHNLEVSDGTLKIIARQEEAPEQFGIRCPYTSARIDTHGKFSFQYGRVVFRARCPIETGFGRQSGCCRRIASTAPGQPPERSISLKQRAAAPKRFRHDSLWRCLSAEHSHRKPGTVAERATDRSISYLRADLGTRFHFLADRWRPLRQSKPMGLNRPEHKIPGPI